jgi:phosphatidylglycerol lysyltransferase
MPFSEVDRARDLVLRFGWNAMAYQILNPGMRLWFAAGGEGVVGYVRAGGYRVVAGAPVCPPERLAEVAAEFAADTRRVRQRLCYFGAQDRMRELLAERGPASALLLGAQPAWDPAHWQGIVSAKASLRAQLARARNKGVTVRRSGSSGEPGLQGCLTEWIERRGLPPMHFLVEWNILPHLLDRRLFVAERAGRTVGFLIASPIPRRDGWLIEQIIRGEAAPNGTTELLLDSAVRAFAEEGARYVTLGLSPLSRAVPQEPAPPWSLRPLLALTRVHARRFYNFEGLERFKRKFLPESWEPIYAITDRPRVSPRTLYAIAGAFGGRSPVLFIGHALLRALGQEARWAVARARTFPALLRAAAGPARTAREEGERPAGVAASARPARRARGAASRGAGARSPRAGG